MEQQEEDPFLLIEELPSFSKEEEEDNKVIPSLE